MKAALMTFCFLAAVSSHADVGFKDGNHHKAFTAEGYINIQCNDNHGPQMGSFRCKEELLDPSDADYFQGPAGVPADTVVLTAQHEDGSTKTKTGTYLSEKNRSKSRFNLWIVTLLQRPLLDFGQNKIHYTLKNNGKVTKEGDFTSLVEDAGIKTCRRTGYYFSSDSQDCINGDRFCSQYFSENNYCQ